MKTYTLKKITGAPDWKNIEIMPIDNLLWTDPLPITAQAQLCWDEEAIYLRMEAFEENIRKEETDPLAEICNDSCLEFFIQPVEGPYYLNFEINPLANYLIGQGDNDVDNRLRVIVPDFETRMEPNVEFTKTGWVLTYKVPFSFIRHFYPSFEVKVGTKIRGNCYKCGDLTEKEHYLAWSPTVSEEPAFHLPEYFGELVFGA